MIKVVGWTRYDNNDIIDFDKVNEYTLLDYENYIRAVIYGLREYNYIYTGFTMNGMCTGHMGYVPVFNNGTKFRCSMRIWSNIISYAYPEFDENDWIMNVPVDNKERIPIYTI